MKDHTIHFSSAVLRRDVSLRMLVPDGENLNCLVLLHGYGGDQDQWCKCSAICRLAEQLGLVVLMPGCGDGYYEDTLEDLPRFVGEELIQFARNHLPVSRAREATAIAGVSMGGFGALLIGAKHPHSFGKIASLSGAFVIPDVVIGNPGVLGNADPRYFKAIFGDFEELEGSSKDPLAVALAAARQQTLPEVYLLCGSQDGLCRENRKIAAALNAQGACVLWREAPGGHTWDFWNGHLESILAWITQ